MILHLASTRRSGAPALLVGLVLAATVAACGGAAPTDDGVVSLASPSASADPGASPAASLDPEEAMQAFTKCMKDHGVDVQVAIATTDGSGTISGGLSLNSSDPGAVAPQTGGGTAEFDPKAMAAADEACRDLLPSGMAGDPSATIPPEQVEQMLAFAKCMRDHGVNMPDPQFSGNGISVQVGGPTGGDAQGIDPNSQAFKDAQDACANEMPGGAPFVVGGSSVETNP